MKIVKKALKCIAAVLVLVLMCMSAGCISRHKCDMCGEEFTGAVYYYGMTDYEQARDVCRSCAADYWAPLSPDGFKK